MISIGDAQRTDPGNTQDLLKSHKFLAGKAEIRRLGVSFYPVVPV